MKSARWWEYNEMLKALQILANWNRLTLVSRNDAYERLRPFNFARETLERIGLPTEYKQDDLDRPRIVCLCGSTRFSEAYQEANLRETLEGRIVLTIGADMKSDNDLFLLMPPNERAHLKKTLDELHLRKIDLADEVLVLNVGDYIGESTQREIEYARNHHKVIRWLEPHGGE